ncbi:helix-turn-helix domain-containing protein [Parabacteroides sp. Marseille-P3160]|uniref:helix-turn-helix domain-containing protein n=1 Tax=Parabacteroides sp. Marseille-P3160 TaxID=1917887 RepID=UPI0009B96C7E|nr:helix-turn-helix domain-containing protein [Parabacteroides sp. Marseille-P3160]
MITMKDTLDLGLDEFINLLLPQETFGNELVVIEMKGDVPKAPFQPMRLNAHSMILPLQGEIEVVMDYVSYSFQKNMLLEMHIENIIDNITFSEDFKGFHIIISQDLLLEIVTPITHLLSDSAEYAKRAYPLNQLNEEETDTILGIVHRIQKYITDKEHRYRSLIIRNDLSNLMLELDNGVWKKRGEEYPEITHSENVSLRFRKLLSRYAKKEHEVSFYASQLNITADHLSKIMRTYSGRSAIKWINHALITEARLLLRKPDMNIQQVSETLNFSDQSVFGKFFKKHTGESPSQYKNIFRSC